MISTMTMKEWAYIIGIVIGGIAVLTACVVWYRKQTFGTGGTLLCIVGVVLIGMSVWGSVKIKLPGGVETELLVKIEEQSAKIEEQSAEMKKQSQRITSVAEGALDVSREVEKLAVVSETNSRQSEVLKKAFEEPAVTRVLSPLVVRRIRATRPAVETVDRRSLERATKLLSASIGGDSL